MTSKRECFVYIVPPDATAFVTAGRFRVTSERDGQAIGAFVYGRSYLARADATPIDPLELRLASRTYETVRLGGFFGAIRDAMPDYWGRLVIERRSGLTVPDEFDYLLHGPDDRAGALGFGLGVEPPAPRRAFNSTLDLARLQEAADSILADNEASNGTAAARAHELLDPGTSMGGARPKAVLSDHDALWIAKFSMLGDRWNQPRVEHAMLQLAARCGLQVADSRITTIGNRDVLLVRRFDRDWTDTGYRRHRMVSALTLLQASDSPQERGGWSYLLLADEIRRSSADPNADLRELFGRMCFNAAISNLDDHPRNHALLARGKNWRLSPAYDLTPSPVVAIDRRDLAMSCGRYGRYANRTNLLSGHGQFLLRKDEATALCDAVFRTVAAEWHAALRRAGVSDQDSAVIAGAFLYEGLMSGATSENV